MQQRYILASCLSALVTHASAQVADSCVSGDVCFKLNIPENTASSGDGDIFFQISAPSSYEWVALGQGMRMAGSNIFVVYTSADANNVTLSPRLASGYTMPSFNGDAEVTLLEGSGVSNGKMTANVRCSNCNSWSGGDADFTSDALSWVYAFQSSSGPKNSDDQSEGISQHDSQGGVNFDYAAAKGGSSTNPLLNAAPGGGGGGPTSCVRRPASGTVATVSPTQTDDDSDDDDDHHHHTRHGRPSDYTGWPTAFPTGRPYEHDSKWHRPFNHDKRQEINYCDDDSQNGFTPIVSGALDNNKKMLIAHGTLAALAFVILFPSGAILMRLASFSGLIWVHAAFQVFAYLVYVVAFGLGVYIANEFDMLNNSHPIVGIALFAALLFMPIFGFLHHLQFKKTGHRSIWSHAHLWLGRAAVTLGIVNGGLGFRLADSMRMGSRSGMIAYAVVAGIVWSVWVAASVIGERRRKKTRAPHPPKYTEHSPRSETALTNIPHPEEGHYAPRSKGAQ